MNKPALLLNLLWVAVAAGSFYAGVAWRGGRPAEASASPVGARVPTAPEPVKLAGSGKTAMVKADTVSRDDDVLDFFRRYGLDSGVPLTADTMGQAVSEAIRETNPIKSQMLFARLMEEITPENAQAALEMVRESASGFDSMRYMNLLAYAWGGADPKSAMETLQAGEGRDSRVGVANALTGWAVQDPQGAIAWLATFEGEGREWLAQSLISGLAKSDFDGAMKYASSLENETERRRATETLAREMIRTGGIDQAKAWLASISDDQMKGGAFSTLADQLRRSDPEKAAQFIRENAGERFARDAVARLAQDLSRRGDINQALSFVDSLNGPNQSRAYAEVIGQWLDRNDGTESVQASEYVTRMPAGENRDAASAAIARRIAGEDPAAAIAWAGAIANARDREQTLVDVGRRYMRTDPASAAAWLTQSGLSAEVQRQIASPREERNWRGQEGGGPPAGAGRGGPRGGGAGFGAGFGGNQGGGGQGGGGGRRGGGGR